MVASSLKFVRDRGFRRILAPSQPVDETIVPADQLFHSSLKSCLCRSVLQKCIAEVSKVKAELEENPNMHFHFVATSPEASLNMSAGCCECLFSSRDGLNILEAHLLSNSSMAAEIYICCCWRIWHCLNAIAQGSRISIVYFTSR